MKNKKSFTIIPSAKVVKMTGVDFIALVVIMTVYALIAFTRLGNTHAPETGYSFVEQGEVSLDLGENKEIAQIWNFLGCYNNPHYVVYYAEDGAQEWTALLPGTANEDGTIDESTCLDGGSVFCWNGRELNITARYLWMAATNTYEDSVLELVLTDAEGETILPVNWQTYETLFDEQGEFEGRGSAMNGTYFDEIYHARTAYEMIHGLYCYENTHPQLGKELMALGVLMFGMNPFGWRFMGALFGVLMVPVLYVFAKKFFKETWISVVATLLFAFDFMHFVQTRIATIDTFVVLFIMLAYYFMYEYMQMSFYDTELKKTFVPLGLCGVSMGLSWACKWTGIYASAGLCILFFAQMFRRYREYRFAVRNVGMKSGEISHYYVSENFWPMFKKTIGFCCVFFVVIPVVIYVLSYLPFVDGSERGLLEKVVEAQKTMYGYHSALTEEHAYSSTWYQWPIIYKPIWYYSGAIGDLREGISAFGNPLVWWAGIPAAVYMLYLILRKKDGKAAFLLIGYLSQYMPWFLVSRTVFIYHYFPSVPFVVMMVAYSLYRLATGKTKWARRAVYCYVALAIGLFVLFYPVLSGMPIYPEFATKYLKWFETWVLLNTWS